MCGSHYFDDSYRNELEEKGFYFDDTGDNISHLNPWLGDLTGLYWTWKNTNDEIVGTNQYRRLWSNEQISSLDFNEKSLYVAGAIDLGRNLYDHFSDCHGEIGMLMLYEASHQKKIPFSFDELNILQRSNIISACNMFFAHRDVFDKVCSVLFDIIFELYHGCKYALPFIQYDNPQKTKQTRMIAFLSERILTLMYHNPKKYFGDVEIIGVGWSTLYD